MRRVIIRRVTITRMNDAIETALLRMAVVQQMLDNGQSEKAVEGFLQSTDIY